MWESEAGIGKGCRELSAVGMGCVEFQLEWGRDKTAQVERERGVGKECMELQLGLGKDGGDQLGLGRSCSGVCPTDGERVPGAPALVLPVPGQHPGG